MKHYPHHIGDFDKATRHLTRCERSVYRDLIDLYYDTERPLTLVKEALCRRIIARSNEETTAVEQVLNEFFTETPTGWYHARCEQEIEAYQANTSQKAMAGKASAEAKRLKKHQALNGNSTPVEHPLNSVETAGNGTSTNQSTINQSTNQPIGGSALKAPKPTKRNLKTALPDDFSISDRVREWAIDRGFHDLDEHLDAFKRKAIAKGYTYASWDDAFMEAVREDWAKLRNSPRNNTSFAQQAADVARTTVPGPVGPDPALVRIAEDRRRAVPMPEEVRAIIQAATRKVA